MSRDNDDGLDDYDDDYDRPQRRSRGRSRERDDDRYLIEDAKAKVAGPAIFLIIVGIINILLGAANLVAYPFMDGIHQTQVQDIQNNPVLTDAQKNQQIDAQNMSHKIQKGMMIPQGAITLIVAILIIVGAVKMKRLSSRGFAMTAAILSMIPCIGCCFLGLGSGIWSLVVLGNEDVKDAFKAQAKGGSQLRDDYDDDFKYE